MQQLDIVKDWIEGNQQERAFIDYEEQVIEIGRHPGKKDFIEFYKKWCLDKNVLCDFSLDQIY